MRRRGDSEFNYWPAMADMVLASFMVVFILWFSGQLPLVQAVASLADDDKNAQRLADQLAAATKEISGLKGQIESDRIKLEEQQSQIARDKQEIAEGERAKKENERLRKTITLRDNEVAILKTQLAEIDKPRIITMDEASGYSFEPGKALLSPEFQDLLRGHIIEEINHALAELGGKVDTIEIVGHTDANRVKHGQSNLDAKLQDVLAKGQAEAVDKLAFGSNADLGLMRSIAVMLFLKSHASAQMANLQYRAYSAAQAIPPEGANATDDARRRRIELRFTRLRK